MNRATRQTSRKTLTAPIRKVRFAWVAIFFCVWVGVIGARLVWLQVIQHAEWVDKAKRQQTAPFEVAPQRGVLYDRNLRELAMTVQVDSIYAVPIGAGREPRGDGGDAGQGRCIPIPSDSFTSRAADAGALQRLEELCVGGAAGGRGDGESRARAESEGRLLPEGVQALLSEQRSCGAGAGLCGHRRYGAGRAGAGVRRRDARRRPGTC